MMALDKYPVTTKAITSAFLTLVGDLICQVLFSFAIVFKLFNRLSFHHFLDISDSFPLASPSYIFLAFAT